MNHAYPVDDHHNVERNEVVKMKTDVMDAINDPKEILVFKTPSGWVKMFVSKGEPTVIPEDAIRLSISFFSAAQAKEALEYWRLMEAEKWSSSG